MNTPFEISLVVYSLPAGPFPLGSSQVLRKAVADVTTPGWVLLDQMGEPQASAWLSYQDRQVWIYPANLDDQPGLSALFEAAKAEAKQKGIPELSVWLETEALLPGTLKHQKQTIYRLELREPGQ